MKPLYAPKGKAKEYGDYAVNIYTGCPHRCYYCFGKVWMVRSEPTRKYKHNYLKELWWNRPWVYFPEVFRFMRKYAYHKKTDDFWVWLRNCFYLNWQVCTEGRRQTLFTMKPVLEFCGWNCRHSFSPYAEVMQTPDFPKDSRYEHHVGEKMGFGLEDDVID